MPGSGRCVLRHCNECRTTLTATTLSLGIFCVPSMYKIEDFAGDDSHLRPYPTNRGDIDNVQKYSQIPTNADSWHKRAQSVLARVSNTHHMDSIQPELWNQVTEVLGEAETILQTRCLSDSELDTVNQIAMVAVKSAPLYPCVSQCAKLWYEIRASAERAQELPHNANTTSFGQRSPVASERGVEAPPKPISSPGNDLSHNFKSYRHLQALSQAETSKLLYQRRHQPPLQFWTHPSGSQERCASSAESLPSEQDHEDVKADFPDQGLQPALLPPPSDDSAGRDSQEACEVGNDGATREYLALVEENVAKLSADLNHAQQGAEIHRRTARLTNVKAQLNTLCVSLSHLSNRLPPLDAQMLAALDKMHSSFTTARAKVRSSQWICMSKRYLIRFDTALSILSHLRHRARLGNMEKDQLLRPQELESFGGVLDFPRELSPSRCGAFTTYAALLTAGNEEVKEIVDELLIFSDLTSKSIDLTTAKLYLLILLYLKYDTVKLVKAGVQNLLDQLISKLRDEIFRSAKTEISIYQMPEFREFCLAYFEVSPGQGFDWRDSLRVNQPLIREGQRPIITKLLQYGKSFSDDLDQLKTLITSARSASRGGIYAAQVESLKAFRRHLLSIEVSTSVFTDDQTLVYLKQFAAFSEQCLNECRVDGHATGHEQLHILAVTLDCLQWCRLLSSYLEVSTPDLLDETYDTMAYALILKSLWSHETTVSLSNPERAFISQGILSALRSDRRDDKLLACTKIFLDHSVPSGFVEALFDELLLDRDGKNSDHDKMVTLLALECRMNMFRGAIASSFGPIRMPSSTEKEFSEALAQAQLIAKGVHIVPAPDVSLNASLQERFVASPAHKAPYHLSVDVVLEEALKETKLNDLTVSEVAHHVATYLLGNSDNKHWLDFLTCQVNWCSFTPKQLAKHQGEWMTLVQSLGTFLRAFWYKDRWVKPLDSSAEATPNLIRHFVNTATLKWLFGKLKESSKCSAERWRLVCKVAGDHVFAWMPKWMILMHGSQALFPSDVTVDPEFFEVLCVDVCRQMRFNPPVKPHSSGLLDNFAVSAQLRRLIRGICFGMLTRQDFEILLCPYHSPWVSRWNRNLFLTFLLYVWHDKSLLVDMAVIKNCIKTVVSESALCSDELGMSVSTMQTCIKKLMSM
eukprot:Blabericola_migrator_1__57@NODE_1013_length_5706_cov_6_123781_g695_i0_p1_GENE_NODE_1013_length_5706_cov_6_123781_g695_i0NODE_1013_length_5706_cov_6_123781_g695_i0_p1_ORF_typecomplete_len1149_score187_08Laminin_II/PF06009_12/1_2e04Laminin_II/PF06009_12/7_5Laminin_II/PF06009_12/31_NODE_1013_length_5706_cov_6_123781_g695_i018055251